MIDAQLGEAQASPDVHEHFSVLFDLIQEINHGVGQEEVFSLVADALRQVFGIDRFAVVLVQEDGSLRLTASLGLSVEYLDVVRQRIDEGAGARALIERKPVWIPDATADPKFDPFQEAAQAEGFRTVLIWPLFLGRDPLGYLIMYHDVPRVYTAAEIALAQALVQQAAFAVHNARLLAVAESHRSERVRLQAELLDLSAHLNSDLSIPILIERVVEAAMSLVRAQSGTLGLVQGERLTFQRFHQPTGWVDFNLDLQPGEGGPGYVWQTREPYVSNDCANDPRVLHGVQENMGFTRLVIVPVINRDGVLIGTLGVYNPEVERDFGQSDVEALQLLAHQAAIALENARLSHLKDEFLSVVSHELKTPITSIKGFTQLLQRRMSPESLERTGRYLNVINQQSDRLTSLINDLLDLSRIQTGRFCFDMSELDYSSLLRDVVAEMQLVSPNHSIDLVAPMHLVVHGNAERLRQVIVNLIDNALKYGPSRGTVHVTVEADSSQVTTSVSDEGPTIPPDEAERIFDPYYQVREPRHYLKGLGLGLFITRRIVEEHDGRIWLESKDYTSFCFTLRRSQPGPVSLVQEA